MRQEEGFSCEKEKTHETVHHTQQKLGVALWAHFYRGGWPEATPLGLDIVDRLDISKGVLTAVHLWSFWIESLLTF